MMLSWGFSFRERDPGSLQVQKLNMVLAHLQAQEASTVAQAPAFAASYVLGSWDYAGTDGTLPRPLQLLGPSADNRDLAFTWFTRNGIAWVLDADEVFALDGATHMVMVKAGLLTMVRAVSANDAFGFLDRTIIANAAAGNITLTLPTLALGREVVAKKVDATANTVTISGATNIDGAASKVIAAQYGVLRLIGGATEWHLV